MKRTALAVLLLPGLLAAQETKTTGDAAKPKADASVSAEVKVGLGVEKRELTGASDTFKVAAGTKIYAWAKVSGLTGGAVKIGFYKGDKELFEKELSIPSSPYRTNAYKTFRKGDGGDWTVKVESATDHSAIASASFKVEVE